MSRISPKPIIAQTLKSWRVSPGMQFALVEDLERHIWVVESCPAGTQVWTLEQAASLARGPKTGPALRDAVRIGRDLQRRIVTGTLPLDERTSTLFRQSLVDADDESPVGIE